MNAYSPAPENRSNAPVSHDLSQLGEILEQAIRHQHPEWIDPNGACPKCASYVYELADEMEGRTPPFALAPTHRDESHAQRNDHGAA